MNQTGNAATEVRWTAQTHQGKVRKNNEDAFLGLRFDQSELTFLGKEGESPINGYEFLFAISDGMGGENAGEFASRSVLASVPELISREFHQRRTSVPDAADARLRWFCQEIHEHARSVSRYYEECQGMGATLSFGWLHEEAIHIAHIGDSRIYHLPANGDMVQLTEDHTVTGRMIREGKLTPQDARTHPHRNHLEKSIGCLPDPVDPQVLSLPYHRGDIFLLCSDGINDGLSDRGLEKLIRTPPSYVHGLMPAQALVKEALEASGRDNLTAMVVEVH